MILLQACITLKRTKAKMDFDPAVGINMAHTSITLTRCTLPDRKSYESRVHVVVCT